MNNAHSGKYYILDLDRTLFNTNKNAELFISVVRKHNPGLADRLKQNDDEFKLRGASFSMRAFIADQLSKEELEAVEKEYLDAVRTVDLLNPGAREIINALSEQGIPFGIVTYGVFEGQTLKLRASQLDRYPHLVTQVREKGELITTWLKEGKFDIPIELAPDGLVVEEVILVDDRALSFEGLPAGARGYWLDAPDNPIQEGSVPESVRTVRTLDDVMKAEDLLH